MTIKYPPYVNAYGNLKNLFEAIKKASVPPKFNQDYLHTILGLKSSSYHAMIPLLKKLGFIDPNNVPTQTYKDFRDDTQSGKIMAERIKEAYSTIFSANEYAYKLEKPQLISKLKTLTGAADDDKVIPSISGTFIELCALADFEGKLKGTKKTQHKEEEQPIPAKADTSPIIMGSGKLGISYTINLNLPATTEIEVFNAIFKSLKEHILDQIEK
jgi:hypothetical protein